nr:nucleotidyltransferase domain-containing protein [Conexibacter arvalis]
MLYTLNRDHVAAPAAVALAQLRSEVVERARREVAAWQIAAQHASVFGSFARGDGDVGSDIDLFVVRPAGVSADDADWREQLDRLAERVRAWTGNHASIAEVASDDLARLREDRPLIVDELSADAIALAGPEALQLFERDAR